MIEFLLFCIATVGLTSIIMHGMILRPFREFVGSQAEKNHERREQKALEIGKKSRRSLAEWLNELLNCAQCTGFWCGLFCGLIFITKDGFLLAGFPLLVLLCCGFGGSFLATLGSNVIDLIFYRKMNALRHLEEQEQMIRDKETSPEKVSEPLL